jgi:hypothetical protein
MDREIWRTLMDAIRRAARAIKSTGREPTYSDALIVAMYLWAVWHKQSLSWACDRLHYNTLFRPRQLPSISQFTRRVKSEACRAILQRVHQDLAARGAVGALGYIDGKGLLVSPVSKDPEAARGHISGGFAKGYKLHAYVNEARRVVVWAVTPLNTDEKVVARELLLPHLPPPADPLHALDLGDKNYDARPLYDGFAGCGRSLITPLRAQQLVGADGHSASALKNMGPIRREALAAWQQRPDLAEYVLEQRNNVEGTFSVLAVACGLDFLPTFVRRLDRVRRWTGAKIIIYHARLWAQEQAEVRAAA